MAVDIEVRESTQRLRARRVWYAVLFAVVLASLVGQTVLVVQGGTDVNASEAAAPAGLAVLGWALVGPRGWVDRATIARAFIWPVAWIAYTLLHSAFTSWYPYPFLDVAEIGYLKSHVNIVLVLAVALALALLAAWADRRLPR